MKKTRFLFALLLSTIFMLSCSKEDVDKENEYVKPHAIHHVDGKKIESDSIIYYVSNNILHVNIINPKEPQLSLMLVDFNLQKTEYILDILPKHSIDFLEKYKNDKTTQLNPIYNEDNIIALNEINELYGNYNIAIQQEVMLDGKDLPTAINNGYIKLKHNGEYYDLEFESVLYPNLITAFKNDNVKTYFITGSIHNLILE
jgi:hypothetical protein